MDQSECMDSLLVAFQRMSDSFNPDMQVMVKMCILSSLLPQLFLLQLHQHSDDKTDNALHAHII